jgi:hypothetical protein
MAVEIVVDASEVIADLRGLSDDLQDIPMDEISKRMAIVGASLAPKRTGKLAASVKPLRSKDNQAGVIATAPYAHIINYGSVKRNIKPTYFLNKIDSVLNAEYTKMVEEAVDELINKRGLS